MKRLIVSISLIVLSVNFIFSQSQDKGTRLGLEFSPSITWFSPNEKHLENDGVKVSYDFGLNAEFYFSDNYAFVTGVFFSNHVGSIKYLEKFDSLETKAANYSIPESESVKYSNKYVRIPIGLKLCTNQIGYNTFYARLGFNTMVNYQSKATADSKLFEKENSYKAMNILNLNYFIGGGVEMSLGSKSAVTLGATYSSGFINTFSSTNHFATNSQVALNIGLIF